jgi:hypothetical protein
MSSITSHAIKHRKNAKDVFYTPTAVAQKHISITERYAEPDDVWLDAFKGQGVYLNNFTNGGSWCEITEGVDFFDYEGDVDVICSNPPYSLLDKVFKKSIDLKPRVISYLLGHGARTPRRIKLFNDAGYYLKHMYITKVFQWYGMSEAVVFVKGETENQLYLEYDRIVHRPDIQIARKITE